MSSNSSRRGAPVIPGISGTPVSGSEPMNGFGIGGPSINSNNGGL